MWCLRCVYGVCGFLCVVCVYVDTDLYTAYMSSSRVGSMQKCKEARKSHCVIRVEHSPSLLPLTDPVSIISG